MPKLDFASGRIEAAHGSGGRAMNDLIETLFVAAFDNEALRTMADGALLRVPPGKLVLATDSHVVTPLFFPGGDIGSLSVHGTINDVAVCGARPLFMSASFILEEGFALRDLQRIVLSMAEASKAAGVPIVTGDTKVVEHGKADGVFITTTGVGAAFDGLQLGTDQLRSGDAIVLSGPIGEHGVAIMTQREGLSFEAPVQSDSAALHTLVQAMVASAGAHLRCMRDPTRGGVSAALNELCAGSAVGMRIRERDIVVREEVAAACELLGLDPLNVANEGKLVAVCSKEGVSVLLDAMQQHPLGVKASIIGEVTDDHAHFVQMETVLGTTRLVDWLAGDQLPRIC